MSIFLSEFLLTYLLDRLSTPLYFASPPLLLVTLDDDDDHHSDEDVGPGDRSFLAVSGGVVLGFLIAFAFPMVLADTGLPIPLLILAPPALGLIALLVPAWRRAGAGFVMGLAIGSMVFAGVCAAFVSYLSISLGA